MATTTKLTLAFMSIVLATISLAGSNATTNDNYACMSTDVRMSADPSIAGRVDGLSERVSRIEANQTIYQCNQDGRLLQLESSLSRIDEVVDLRVDGRCEKKVGDLRELADGFYESRYKELKAAHDRFMDQLDKWLMVIGILVTIFGAGVPLLIGVKQWWDSKRIFREARREVRQEIRISRKAKERELDLLRKESLRIMHVCLAETVATFDLLTKESGALEKTLLLGNVIICMHEAIHHAMITNDDLLVAKEVATIRPFVERWRDKGDDSRAFVWKGACRLASQSICIEESRLRRKDFERVLSASMDDLKFLESFYADFAPWK